MGEDHKIFYFIVLSYRNLGKKFRDTRNMKSSETFVYEYGLCRCGSKCNSTSIYPKKITLVPPTVKHFHNATIKCWTNKVILSFTFPSNSRITQTTWLFCYFQNNIILLNFIFFVNKVNFRGRFWPNFYHLRGRRSNFFRKNQFWDNIVLTKVTVICNFFGIFQSLKMFIFSSVWDFHLKLSQYPKILNALF